MDKATRNAIERATQQARELLREDFSFQLEGTFDVLRSGVVASKGGAHLSPLQRSQRDRIVAAIEHKRSVGMNAVDAVTDYLRDTAFTTLNRFVALKMLEARELVQESITKGEQSAGYREFCGMAPGVALLPDAAGYRLYIESLFDEFSTEIKVLFDRRDPATVLWPKRQTFDALLAILNAQELSAIWGEDETIGWVYQFFNSGQERKKMREESQAPRNNRELAARNQFFTPRYVVQFLTDNTLGRIWYEMRGGSTELTGRCEYMVRRPEESYPPRPKKDPRDIRVLDPACGSGHFLLYAFDIFLTIYEEAYTDHERPNSEATGRSLADDYLNIGELKRELPALIIEHNLHGIDIDPRCTQIAQLALWMRAQRAFRDYGVGQAERQPIRRSKIVVAEPMPGEADLRREFAASLTPELSKLVSHVFETMELAGEAGPLLKIEDNIRAAIRETYGTVGGLFSKSDEARWQEAELLLRSALHDYVAKSHGSRGIRRRLFADDAEHGLGFIELCRQTYDAIVMNPPFGAPSLRAKEYTDLAYERWRHDLGPCFVSSMCDRLSETGMLGALTPRTYFTLTRLAEWRSEYLLGNVAISSIADLGFKVLDDAMVEVAAYCCSKSDHTELVALDCLGVSEEFKGSALLHFINQVREGVFDGGAYIRRLRNLQGIPQMRLVYWAPDNLIELFQKHEALDNGETCVVREGLHTGDNERSLRLWWEVSPKEGRWHPFPKGGEYCAFYSDVDLVIDWKHEGRDVLAASHGVVPSREFYFRPGVTYTRRTASGISFRALPRGSIFSSTGPIVWAASDNDVLVLLSYLSSRLARTLVEYLVGGGDSAVSRGSARDFMTGLISVLPSPKWPVDLAAELSDAAKLCWAQMRTQYRFDETDYAFEPCWTDEGSVRDLAKQHAKDIFDAAIAVLDATWAIDKRISDFLGLDSNDLNAIAAAVGEHPVAFESNLVDPQKASELASLTDDELVDRVAEFHKSRDATKQFHFAHRRLELTSRALRVHPLALREWFTVPRTSEESHIAWAYVSWLVGQCFHRWPVPNEGALKLVVPDPLQAITRPAPFTSSGRGKDSQIFVDDEGSASDLCEEIYRIVQQFWSTFGHARLDEALELLGHEAGALRDAVRRTFFARHLLHYTKARRRAPIYWQLSTPSLGYSVWLYFHAINKDTLYSVQSEYVAPKLAHEERRLESLRRELGENPKATERKTLAAQEMFVNDLRAFLEDVKRVAPIWNPDLDDGVLINFAPLWRLVPHHKAWQKELKDTWNALCVGDYDWAHLAILLWPERVITKCATDRSLAIAHGLEDVFWVEGDNEKWKPRPVPTRPVDELVRERTSVAVKEALKTLLEAPAAKANGGRVRGRRVANAVADGGAR